MTAIHADHSLFTVPFDVWKGYEGSRIPGGELREPGDQSFDLAVIEFDDDGQFEKQVQLRRAADWITARRAGDFTEHGVVVVVFVDGWHHGARWEDTHFVAFRKVLRALAVREMERRDSRRVIGLYLAWRGNPLGRLCLSKSRNEDTALHLEACNHRVSPPRTPHDASRSRTSAVIHGNREALNGRMVRVVCPRRPRRRLRGNAVVAVVQSADFWGSDDGSGRWRCDWAGNRCVLA
jgi:hypothetical protein